MYDIICKPGGAIMQREIIILNNSNSLLSKNNINCLIVEINKLSIDKTMKELLLIASTNLISTVKTTKALIYQLETFKSHGQVMPNKTKSKYLNKIILDLSKLSTEDFTTNIDNLINFITTNNINLTIQANKKAVI